MVAMATESRKRTVEDTDSGSAKKAKKKSSSHYDCEVTCLDGSKLNLTVNKSGKGEVLFMKIIEDLSITEKEYMGLLFNDDKGVKVWLDIHKDMKHQLKDAKPNFELRVKFYEPEPTRLQDEYMRYLLYLQLREDITMGRLVCSDNIYVTLGAYTAQAELGDFHLSEHDHNYLDDYDFAPEKSATMNKNIHELHKEHRGQTPAQAELNFLEVAKKIPLYGVDIHHAHDVEGPVDIGMAALGINIYRNDQRECLFKWQSVDAILYNRRKFTVKLKEPLENDHNKENKPNLTYIYYSDSAKECKQCYKSAVEYHTFFRLTRPDAPRKKADKLKLGSSFRYSDRTLYQLRHKPSFNDSNVSDTSFNRTPSKRRPKPDLKEVSEEESPMQYEEIEMDESNPDDDKYDPKEWEVVEKTLPDGTKKRYRRRVIIVKPNKNKNDIPMVEETPLGHELIPIDESNPEDEKYNPKDWVIVEKTLPDGTKKRYRQRRPGGNVPMVEEGPVYYQEEKVDENNPEDDKHDPEEWATVEKKLPDGTKKKYRRRIITVTRKGEDDPMNDQVTIPFKEVEIDERNPEDEKYDPKEWETIEKKTPRGKKKRLRRKKIHIVNVVARRPLEDGKPDNSSVTVVESPFDYEEVELTEANPNDENFDPELFEVVEKPQPDGTKKRFRRRIIILTKPKLSDDKKDVESKDGIIPMIEESPIRYEEVDVDHAHPENDDQFKPQDWDIVETTDPDGNKKKLRRRVIVVTTLKKRKGDNDDVPMVEEGPVSYQEEEVNENNPQDGKYDPEEWATVEKKLPDGTKKKCRRRIITVTRIGEDDPVNDEDNIPFEEVEIDERNPEDEKYDPKEWETIEKKTPGGKKKRLRRRKIRIVNVVARRPLEDDKPDNSSLTVVESPFDHEEVELTETNPKDENFDPELFEVVEKPQPDGTKKRFRRRIIVLIKPKLSDDKKDVESKDGIIPMIEESPIRYEEVDVDHVHPENDDQFKPQDWEIVDKIDPDGNKKKLRRRVIVVTTLKKRKGDNDDVPMVEEGPVCYQEEEVNENNPQDGKYDPEEWATVEKKLPDGTKKKYRRRIITVTRKGEDDPMNDQVTIPFEEVEIDERNPEDEKYDPKEWETIEKKTPRGKKKRLRRKKIHIVNVVARRPLEDGKPDNSSVTVVESPFDYEEVELTEANPNDENFDPELFEVVEKPQPDGTKKRFRRRIIILTKPKLSDDKKDVESKDGIIPMIEESPIRYEEVDVDHAHPENDDQFKSQDWEIVDKIDPDGNEKEIRRRVIVVTTLKKRKGDSDNVPMVEEGPIEYEEVEIDESNPEDEKYNPKDWEVVEKTLPNGTKKRYRRRIIVIAVARKNKPDDVTSIVDKAPIQYEEVEIDESNPEDEKYDPKDWEVVEKTLPDGSKKRVRRRIVVISVIRKNKPKDDDSVVEEAPIQFEEVEIDESNPEDEKYDPKDWEVVEKTLPDGSKKRVRRRIVVISVIRKNKPKDDDSVVEEAPIQYEEVEIDESNPEDEKYDPKDWEVVEKTLPDGSKKRVRRRIVVISVIRKNKPKDDDSVVEEAPIQYEEVEIDESNPEDEKYDPKEWEVVEKTLPDGTKKKVRRRVVIVLLVAGKKGKDLPLVEERPVVYEEMEVDDEEEPDDNNLDPDEWEVIEKNLPNGEKKKYRRRLVNVILTKKGEDDPMLDEAHIPYEEIEIDETNPSDGRYDPEEYETVETTRPDGTKRRVVRKKVVLVKVTAIKPKTDDKNAIVAPVMVVETPFNEEVPIDENDPQDDKFNPEDWEVVEKSQPDGTKKRFRRRIIVLTKPKLSDDKKDVESKDGIIPMIEESPIRYEEVDVDHAHPENDDQFKPQDWDIVEKTLPDGTKKVFRRRVITVATIKKRNGKADDVMPKVSEAPIQFEEVEVDESNPEDEKYDPIDWEIVRRTRPDGVRIRVRRRVVSITVVKKPKQPEDQPIVEETPLQYEEIEIDETNPEDEKYDPKDWEVVEKTLPDGTKKRYRRRIIVISIGRKNKPDDVTPIVNEAPVQYEEVEIDESNPEDEKYDPEDWEIVEKELPDGTKKRYRRRIITIVTTTTTTYIVHPDGRQEEVSTETSPVVTVLNGPDGKSEKLPDDYVIVSENTTTTESGLEELDGEVQLPVLDVNMDDILTEINAMSRSLDDEGKGVDKPQKIKENDKLKTLDDEMQKLQLEQDEETEEERRKREEDRRRRSEEEKRLGEDLNATIDSIFTLPEEELAERPERPRFQDISFEIPEDHIKVESDDDLEFVSVADAEYIGIDTDEMIRTASLLRQKKEDEKKTKPTAIVKPKPAKRSATVPNQRASTGDIVTPRKLSAGPKPARPLSNVGLDQSDYHRPHESGSSQIIYTVTDVSNVEQGAGGFVRAVKAKHEGIATEEEKSVRRSSRVSSDGEPPYTPKGHVPTRTVSFDENDKAKVIRTKAPPAVAAKPTVIVPATSELPDEEVVFEVNQIPEESHPDIEHDIIEPTDLPQVETQPVIFRPIEDDVKVVPVGDEPDIVETHVVHIVPQTESRTIETIHVFPPDVNTHETESQCIVTTHTLPTEVITKTITIEGDTENMTPEELQKLIAEAGGDSESIETSTYTQVVKTTTVQKVITGQTITVTGDGTEEEMNRMIRNAVESANENAGDDRTIVLTAVQTYEEEVDDEDEHGDTEI
ncbi:titin-like isoform X2 [Hydractinia symbiolongicarpus]|uniref:titin-like isoform X2 n=1 Tax=Hydractinia symbiolongicarpus TaxID=13093 RepID=UPI00254D53A7|nr:titin-like isoform X2 [Hydractinia symbiolongicarpus]